MTGTSEIKSSCIEHATDITMDAFIDIMVEGRYELLVKEGQPSDEDLKRAWNLIYAEYMDAMGDDGYKKTIGILRDINILSWQHQRITTLVQVLSVYYVPEAVKELKKMGYSINYDPGNLTAYQIDLQRAYERAKTLLTKISILQNDLKSATGKASTRQDYQTMFISLSEYAKYQVHPAQISAFQFAVMMKRCNEYAKGLEKQLHKGGKSWQKN
ncbi:MAG: hypothetical protein EPN37_07225 [Chitinophagaceae bacterium]|nr:MAG: hypothetical protein EPN37_07225 [Chitinophagaceae bacterium]